MTTKKKRAPDGGKREVEIRLGGKQLESMTHFAEQVGVPVESVLAVFLGLGINTHMETRHSLVMAGMLARCQDALTEKWHPDKTKALVKAVEALLVDYAKHAKARSVS